MNGLEDHTLYTFVISRPYIEKGFDPPNNPLFQFLSLRGPLVGPYRCVGPATGLDPSH